MGDPRRILIVRFSHLGDVVHALGVFHALREAHSSAEIAWAVQTEFADLLRGLPGLDRLVLFERRGGPLAWARLARELRNFRADLTVDAQGNLKSAAATWLSRAPRRVGLARRDWRERAGAWVVNDTAPPLSPTQPHAMHRMRALALHAAPRTSGALRTDPALTEAEAARGEARLEELLGRAEGGWILSVSSPEDVRAWPPVRWEELARALVELEQPVLLVSGPGDEGVAELLRRGLRDTPVVHWPGRKDLRELAATLAAAAGRGLRFVGRDSGPMHLAAASGLGVIALEGPRDERLTGPWPPADADGPHRVVRARVEPPCAPCLSRRCGHALGPVCMEGIAVDDVLAAAGLARRGGGAERRGI